MSESQNKLVSLGVEPPPPPAPSPPGRMQGFAITGMALSAFVGIIAMLMFATVQWSEPTRRYVVGALVVAVIGFVTFAAAAVLTAARDTYPRRGRGSDQG